MSEERTEEIKVDSPRKPLEPVGDGVSEEQRRVYAQLLAEFSPKCGITSTCESNLHLRQGKSETNFAGARPDEVGTVSVAGATQQTRRCDFGQGVGECSNMRFPKKDRTYGQGRRERARNPYS